MSCYQIVCLLYYIKMLYTWNTTNCAMLLTLVSVSDPFFTSIQDAARLIWGWIDGMDTVGRGLKEGLLERGDGSDLTGEG